MLGFEYIYIYVHIYVHVYVCVCTIHMYICTIHIPIQRRREQGDKEVSTPKLITGGGGAGPSQIRAPILFFKCFS